MTKPHRYLACLLFWSAQAAAQTVISGGNLVNQTWTTAGSPYVIQGDATVPAGTFLTIEAGTAVHFAGADAQGSGLDTARVELTVNGTLTVTGTSVAPVAFRAQSGDAAGTWYGLVITASATSAALSHFTLEHALTGLTSSASGTALALSQARVSKSSQCGVRIEAGTPALSGLELSQNGAGLCYVGSGGGSAAFTAMTQNTGDGVEIGQAVGAAISLTNVTVHANGGAGILALSPASGATGLVVKNSIVTSNGAYGIRREGEQIAVSATYNDVWDNAAGNYLNLTPGTASVSVYPRYVNAPADLRLAALSPVGCHSDTASYLGAYPALGCVPLRVRGDFSGDGRSDVLWRNGATGENYLYPMEDKSILPSEGYLRTVADASWKVAALGDFNGDSRTDILWRNSSTGENYVYLMDGTAIAGEGYLRTVADPSWEVAGAADLDGDFKDDIVWRNAATGENYLYPMDGLAIKPGEGFLRTVADQNWRIAGLADFDGDGKADLLWRNFATGENYLYPMDGLTIKPTEGFLRTVADLSWKIVGAADFDGDGKADLLWRNWASGENYLYPMNGTTILAGEGYLRTVPEQHWRVQASGDYDGDGSADVLWRHAVTGENYVYFMQGTTLKPTEGYLRTVADPNWKVAAGAPLLPLLADVLIALDSSGSMGEELGFVQSLINSFATSIKAAGVDLNIVVLAEAGAFCAPAPLGSGACPADENLPGYRHVPVTIGSTDAFQQILNTHAQWSASFRPGARRTLVVVTDDDSGTSAASFHASLLALDPGLAGYRFNAVVAPVDPVFFPVKNECADFASAAGTAYMDLATQTGGLSGDLCAQDFGPVFDAFAARIIASTP